MLGSFFIFFTLLFIVFVSKPYRYARKYWDLELMVIPLQGFQNLIGMLGSRNISLASILAFPVSKPYRYARKQDQDQVQVQDQVVSKPYRYARKESIMNKGL